MKRTTTRLALLLSCLAAIPFSSAHAIEDGVYRIINAAYSRAVVEDFVNSRVTTTNNVGTSVTDWEQLWEVKNTSGSSYSIQNVYTGRYVSSNVYRSNQMTMSDSQCSLTLTAASYDSNGFTILGSMYAHCASSQAYWLVGWNTPDAAANTFYFNKVDGVDVEAARAAFKAFNEPQQKESAYNTALQTFFTDASCTQLKDSYQSMTDEDLTAALTDAGLHQVLQDMALKVKNDSWTQFEKKFRVHDYEISANAGNWNGFTRQSVQTNMKNPTGIIADGRQLLYVMVRDEIPENATLYIKACVGCSYLTIPDDGTRLHQGLNVVPVSSDASSFFIMYSVNSYNNGSYLPLSQFPSLNIHIEGGKVDGYYQMGDGKEVFDWLVANHSHQMIQLKGSQTLIQFYAQDFRNGAASATIDEGIASWDWILKWQYSLLGLRYDKTDAVTTEYISSEGVTQTDIVYPDYYNSYHLAFGDKNGFMDAGAWRTHYNVSWSGLLNMNSFLFGGACSMWGAAHEIGHTNQGVFNMPGGTEVTNNLLSNVTNFMAGFGDSRGNTNIDVQNYYRKGTPWYNYDIWAQTRMYYKLFLYFHAAKNDITFYPRLFSALRKDPLRFGSGNSTSNPTLGENMHLKFYEKCCEIAQQDLTPFFEAYGFFVPMNLLLVGDYTNHYVTSTQEMIDAAIARVKAKKYPVNTAIIFIDDRSEDVPVSGLYKSKGGTGIKANHGDYPTTDRLGYTTGSFTRYTEDAQASPSGYTLSQEGRTITFSGGTGAQGFVIYDSEGNMVGFTNTSSFTFPETYDGSNVTISAVGSNQKEEEISGFDPDEAVYGTLRTTMLSVSGVLDKEDLDGKHPGFYPTAVLTTLKSLYSQAQDAIDKKEIQKYPTLNSQMLDEMNRVKNDTNSKTPIRSDRYYRLRNFYYPERYMTLNGNNVSTNTDSDAAKTANWWRFYPTGTAGQWRIASYDGHFIGYIAQSSQATAKVTDEASALLFNTTDNQDGTFFFCKPEGGNNGLHCASNANYNIVGWNNSSASRWYLDEVQGEGITISKDKLNDLYKLTQNLVTQVADVTYLQLQGDNESSDFYLFSNADYNKMSGNSDGNGIPGLLDGDRDTHFHSLYGNSGKVKEYHYLQVNLGEAMALQDFRFNYATRSTNSFDKPTNIVVSGSNDGTDFEAIKTFTSADTDNPLPSSTSVNYMEWQSSLIHCSEQYKYLRFTVMATSTPGHTSDGYPFFTLSEFGITPQYPYFTIKTEDYPKVTRQNVTDTFDAIYSAGLCLNDISYTESEISDAYEALLSAYISLKDLVSPEVTYEYYFGDEKKASETLPIVIGDSYPAPTVSSLPFGIQMPLAPEGKTTGCETVRINLTLSDDYPIAYSTGIDDARWYSIYMRNYGKNGGYAHFDGTKYPEQNLSSAPSTPDYLFAFVGDPWGFRILTPNNTFLYNSGTSNESCTPKSKESSSIFQLHRMDVQNPTYGQYYIDIVGKVGTLHDTNNSLGFWNDSQAYCSGGSQIALAEVALDVYHVDFGTDAPEGVSISYKGTEASPSSVNRAFVVTPPVSLSDLTIVEPEGYEVSASIEGKTIRLGYTPYYTITISSCGYTTFYADEPTLVPEGCEVFYVSDYQGNFDEGTLSLEPATGYVAPRQGVVVKGTAGSTYRFTHATDAEVSAPATNHLVGYAESQSAKSYEVGDGWYYLSTSGSFRKLVTPSYSLLAHKAYLFIGRNEVKEFRLEGEITSLTPDSPLLTPDSPLLTPNSSLLTPNSDKSAYNLAGQIVSDSYRGIVIVNGKKVFNK